nr:AP-1 complex subunit sigma-1 [Tanacetum cinerariifolium]
MIHFVLLISRQGKVRLTKWYSPYTQKERSKVIRELSGMILTRGPKLCNFVEWRGFKVVYKSAILVFMESGKRDHYWFQVQTPKCGDPDFKMERRYIRFTLFS